MTSVDLSIVHPFDPSSPGLGGYDTFLTGFFREAPAEWRLEVVGVTRDPGARPVGRVTRVEALGREIDFVPILAEPDPYSHRLLPLSLRFALAARRGGVAPRGAIVQYHRFESVLALPPGRPSHAACFLHNHPPELLSEGSDVRWRCLRPLFRRALGRSLGHVDSIWCVDPRTPEWLETLGRRADARLQPVWADLALFTPGTAGTRAAERRQLRAELGLESDERICLFAGRFERQKDPLLLVRAFALAAARFDAVSTAGTDRPRLLFVGRGRLRARIAEEATRRGLEDRVLFLPPRSRERLASIYRASDVAVCCSAFESGPRTVFEALACGTPVVTVEVGQVGGPMGRLSDLGLLVEDRSAERLAAALGRALALEHGPTLWSRCVAAVGDATPRAALAPLLGDYAERLADRRR